MQKAWRQSARLSSGRRIGCNALARAASADRDSPARLDDFIAADYVGHLGAVTMDRDELEHLEREFCRAFPDAHHRVSGELDR